MNAVFKKLNFKDQSVLHVINAPESFKTALAELSDVVTIKKSLTNGDAVSFFLAFVTRQAEVDNLVKVVVPLLDPAGLLWFAYPKGSSRRYKCEFNRDSGWKALGEVGFEGVRMIAIDEDWSALRFKRVADIKSMTRSFAMSEQGKKKVEATKAEKEHEMWN